MPTEKKDWHHNSFDFYIRCVAALAMVGRAIVAALFAMFCGFYGLQLF